MKPMYLSISQKETGIRIKNLLSENGYTVRDVQAAMGFENPQSIYKWLSGKSLPNLDNFVILSRLLHTSIEDILVIDGDIVRLCGCSHISWRILRWIFLWVYR
ncbi:MAG: helix-turn-helix transcriptional regulator [Blautia sp.]|nr:helix-turn-helix transcriptional regulator [Blautia sp.]